jgi:hypothetical protein
MENNQLIGLIGRLVLLDKKALELLLCVNQCLGVARKKQDAQLGLKRLSREFKLSDLKNVQVSYVEIAQEIKVKSAQKSFSRVESILIQEAILKLGRRMEKIGKNVASLKAMKSNGEEG